ncbi:hypothetical protein [Maritalea sp.]|uniref:hypothetical protein n=1 Tax=Maritalea sp. TaxID=2003361 RepID=UPI003EF0E644
MDQITNHWGIIQPILAALGLGTLIAAVLVTACFQLFKWLGAKWISQKFEKELEAYKTEQSKELEGLRHKIKGVLDRTIRLHTKEFEVLPDLSGELVEAHSWCRGYVAPFQSYANVGAMDVGELAEFLETTEFMEVHKRDIKAVTNSVDKQRAYNRTAAHYESIAASEHMRTLSTGLRNEGVFLSPN